jgi:calcium/calmodulin-dependent protein kinase I
VKGSVLVLLGENGRHIKRTRLFGYRVLPLRASRTQEDAVPSFVDNCICLRKNPTEGFALAFPNQEALMRLCDRLCACACIMRDINDHLVITASFDDFQLVRPTSARTGTMTEAEVLVLKSTSAMDKQSQLFNEARFLMTLRDKSIVRAYGLYEVKLQGRHGMGLLLDYFEGHDLSGWITTDALPEWIIKTVVVQVRDSLTYLSGLSIVHRDLKPSNVFVKPGQDGSMRVVLGDFGLATFVDDEDISRRCGSPGFIAPEMFLEEWPQVYAAIQQSHEVTEHVLKIDVFSLAIVIYGMALAANPFIAATLTQTYKLNARGRIRAADLDGFSAELRSLFMWMSAKDPVRRCSIAEASTHAWFGLDLVTLGYTGEATEIRGDSVSWRAFEQAAGHTTEE